MTEIMRTYLDYNATAPVHEAVRACVVEIMEQVGNASSVHAEGRGARADMEHARRRIAELIAAEPGNLVFTSGGTEANNLGLRGICAAGLVDRVLMSAIEHPSMFAAADATGLDVIRLPVGSNGVLDLNALEAALTGKTGAALLCLMLANNETGAVQPVAEAARLVHGHDGLVLVDAVQAAGKIEVDFGALGADLMTVSAHKIGGLTGTGALAVRGGLELTPLIVGGGQELNRRGGTENIAGIVAFGVAAKAARRDLAASGMAALTARLEAGLGAAAQGVVIFAKDAPRLPNTCCFAQSGLSAETALIALDLKGFAVSSGSACSSGKVAQSHVLAAMGVEPELARGALRVSLGPATSADEIDRFIAAWGQVHERSKQSAAA